MKTRFLAALLALATAGMAFAQSNPGAEAPIPSTRAEPLAFRAPASAFTELRVAPLPEANEKRLEPELAPNQIGISRRADVAAMAIDQSRLEWRAAAGGFAAQLRVVLPGAAGMRVGLRLHSFPRTLQLRVGEPRAGGGVESVAMTTAGELSKLGRGRLPMEYWTPTTLGETQAIELWVASESDTRRLRFALFDASHLLVSPWSAAVPKVLLCHVDAGCAADATVQAERRAVARMLFVHDGRTSVCTGSLLNDRASSGTPLFATAHHCISSSDAASTLETWWLYYPATCGGIPPSPTRLTGGATLLIAYGDNDFTLLRLNRQPPAGTAFLGWNPAPLTPGQAVYGLHHPDGSYQRYMGGVFLGRSRVTDSETRITFADPLDDIETRRGILEGGSSGSPLLTTGGEFRGTLFGGPSSNACANPTNRASYSDFSRYYPLVHTYLNGPSATDEHGDSAATAVPTATDGLFAGEINRVGDQDWFRFQFTGPGEFTVRSISIQPESPVDVAATLYGADGTTAIAANDDRTPGDANFEMTVAIPAAGTYFLAVTGVQGAVGRYGLRASVVPPDDHSDSAAGATALAANGTATGLIAKPGDADWFRIAIDRSGVLRVRSTGSTDVVGRFYAADGVTVLAENDDANPPDTNFGLTASVQAGTVVYLRVAGFEDETGAYALVSSLGDANAANYTDLWWNAAESGWGLNLNHQSDILFGTLFTYAADGGAMWLVASRLDLQPDGSFTGPLYRIRGPAFNANPWGAVVPTEVGTMRVTFTDTGHGSVTYTVNGTAVTKQIERQPIAGAPPTCTFTVASRNTATNYQDLWWNPAETGWGINIAQQGTIVFATLFTYDATGRDLWLVGSRLERQPNGSFSGPLYRTTGPVFNASPWTGAVPVEVGTMTIAFSNGNTGTLTYNVNGVQVVKTITRQLFGAVPSVCN